MSHEKPSPRPADWTCLEEYTPLAPLDEYMVHNSIAPISVPQTSDLRMYDRMWFTAQDMGGDLFVVFGIGFYPNLQTAEAHAQVIYKGELIYLHAHRPLGNNLMNMRVGPIEFENIEPYKEWRIRLDDNKYGIQFDLRWFDTKRAIYDRMDTDRYMGIMSRINVETTAGYESFGVIDGWVEHQGRRFTMNPATSNGSRDHHWGTRDGVGGPGRSRKSGGQTGGHPLCGQWVEFKHWSVWGWKDLPNIGADRGQLDFTFTPDYKLKFDPKTKMFTEGVITNFYQNGNKRELHWRRIENQVAFLRCGMYGGVNGGTPDGDLWWGMDVGEHLGGGAHDLSKPEDQIYLCGGNQHLCEVSCGNETVIGVFEPWEPTAYEWCVNRIMPNFALLEN